MRFRLSIRDFEKSLANKKLRDLTSFARHRLFFIVLSASDVKSFINCIMKFWMILDI